MAERKEFWICSFCRRKKSSRRSLVEKHENNCFGNPNRTPYLGELSFVARTGKIVNYGFDESIGGDRLEWVEHDEMPPWWPAGPGMIFDGKEWRAVPGYVQFPAKPGHGCAGGAPMDEVWPMLEGEPLPQVQAARRLEILA